MRFSKKVFMILLACLMVVVVLSPLGCGEKKTTGPIRVIFATGLATDLGEGYIWTKIADNIENEMAGEVEFSYHPAEVLYGWEDIITAIQTGALQMGGTQPYYLERLEKDWMIFSIPMMIDDIDHWYRVTETQAYQDLLARTEAKGVKVIGYPIITGAFNFYNNLHPIKTLDDFGDVRLRVLPSEAIKRCLDTLGGNIIAMSGSEVTTALQTGMIDGVTTDHTGMRDFGLYRACPYCTVANILTCQAILVVSATWWNDLPEDIQKQLEEIFNEATLWAKGYMIDAEEANMQFYKDTPGNEVFEGPEAEALRAQIFQLMQPVIQELISEASPDLIAAVESTRAK